MTPFPIPECVLALPNEQEICVMADELKPKEDVPQDSGSHVPTPPPPPPSGK